MVSVFYELHVIIAHCSLIILPRQQKGTAFGRDVAPLGREVGVTGFARGLHIVSLIGSSFLLPDLLQFEVICNDFEAVITGAPSNAPSGMHVG